MMTRSELLDKVRSILNSPLTSCDLPTREELKATKGWEEWVVREVVHRIIEDRRQRLRKLLLATNPCATCGLHLKVCRCQRDAPVGDCHGTETVRKA